MFDKFSSIFAPHPEPWPFPKKKWDLKDIVIAALLYLMYLILTKGVATGVAFTMASKKYGIAEDVLRKSAKDQPWA